MGGRKVCQLGWVERWIERGSGRVSEGRGEKREREMVSLGRRGRGNGRARREGTSFVPRSRPRPVSKHPSPPLLGEPKGPASRQASSPSTSLLSSPWTKSFPRPRGSISRCIQRLSFFLGVTDFVDFLSRKTENEHGGGDKLNEFIEKLFGVLGGI